MERYRITNEYRAADTRYDAMEYRRCGRSGIRLSALALGFWHNFGSWDVLEESRQTMRLAFDAGITYFDLANNYGPPYGSAEENFGRLMRQDFHPYRDEMVIATKAGYDMWNGPYGSGGSRKYLLASLDASLRRMGLQYVDIFYHHCMDPDTPLEETMGALAQAVRSGRALYAGLSNYSPERACEAVALLREMGVPCLIEQSRYNLFSREPEDGLMDAMQEQGVGFAAFSPLAQGLLTGKYNRLKIPADSRAAGRSPFLTQQVQNPAVRETLCRLQQIADAREQSMAQLALSWVLRTNRVSTVIIGAKNTQQLLQNLDALSAAALSSGELSAIDAAMRGETQR